MPTVVQNMDVYVLLTINDMSKPLTYALQYGSMILSVWSHRCLFIIKHSICNHWGTTQCVIGHWECACHTLK